MSSGPNFTSRLTPTMTSNPAGAIFCTNSAIDGKPLEQVIVTIDIPANERTRQRLSTGLLVRPWESSMDGFEDRLSTAKETGQKTGDGFILWSNGEAGFDHDFPAEAEYVVRLRTHASSYAQPYSRLEPSCYSGAPIRCATSR